LCNNCDYRIIAADAESPCAIGGRVDSERQMAKKKSRRIRVRKEEQIVSPFTAQHGDYRKELLVDLSGELGGRRQSILRVVRNAAVTTVERWLRQGGPGFDEPQRRAIDHMLALWRITGSGPRVTTNYSAVASGASGGPGDRENYLSALHAIEAYQREFPPYVWEAFERVVRFDEPAGAAGSRMAGNNAQQQAHAKACVGFVASKIAEWRGY
jgi:hypothetical protein